MKHDHSKPPDCWGDHEIKLCSHCDVVYCGLCSKEWGEQVMIYTPNWPIIPIVVGDTYPWDKVTISSETTTNPVPETTWAAPIVYACTHSRCRNIASGTKCYDKHEMAEMAEMIKEQKDNWPHSTVVTSTPPEGMNNPVPDFSLWHGDHVPQA